MSPQTAEKSTKSKKSSLLPTHGHTPPPDIQTTLQREYDAADTKLLRLEEELDFLIHCHDLLREQRTELTQDYLKYPKDPSSTKTQLQESEELMNKYLALYSKSKSIDESMKKLKEECAIARSNCNHLLAKIRKESGPKDFKFFGRRRLHSENSLVHGGAESGFTDRDAVAERIMVAEHTAINVGAVVGALGAGIAYTTLFSASRGRLDLIAWAFTCFIIVVISCASLQMFSLPRHGQMARILRMEYVGSAEHRMFVFGLLVGLPMITGFILLAVSVAVLDVTSNSTVPGSQISVRAAGYLPVGVLGYFVILGILIALGAGVIRVLSMLDILEWPIEDLPAAAQKAYPSLLYEVKDKLHYLPGGAGYRTYRQHRIKRRDSAIAEKQSQNIATSP